MHFVRLERNFLRHLTELFTAATTALRGGIEGDVIDYLNEGDTVNRIH